MTALFKYAKIIYSKCLPPGPYPSPFRSAVHTKYGELSCQFVVLFYLFMENNVPMQLFFEAFLGHQPGGPPRADINDGGGLAEDAAG
jgi:hypothetical protein